MKAGDTVKVINPLNPYVYRKKGRITKIRKGLMKYEVRIGKRKMYFAETEIVKEVDDGVYSV